MTAPTFPMFNPPSTDIHTRRGQPLSRQGSSQQERFEQVLASAERTVNEAQAGNINTDGQTNLMPRAKARADEQPADQVEKHATGQSVSDFVIQALDHMGLNKTSDSPYPNMEKQTETMDALGAHDQAVAGMLQLLQIAPASPPSLSGNSKIAAATLPDMTEVQVDALPITQMLNASSHSDIQDVLDENLLPKSVDTNPDTFDLRYQPSTTNISEKGAATLAGADSETHQLQAQAALRAATSITSTQALTELKVNEALSSAASAVTGSRAGQSSVFDAVSAAMMQAEHMPLEASLIKSGAVAAPQDTISARFGSPHWSEAVSQKIIWMVGREQQTATLTLNPPDLGPLQVVVAVHQNQADTIFVAQNSEVRQALQDGLDNLRYMMHQAGIQLGQTQVQDERQSPQFSKQDTGKAAADENKQVAQASPAGHRRVSNGLVDTFV